MTLTTKKTILFILDIFSFYLALIITLFLGFGKNLSWAIIRLHFVAFSYLYPIFATSLFIFDNYNLNKKHSFSIVIKLTATIILFSILAIAFFYTFNSLGVTPKINLLIFVIVVSILLLTIRVALFSLFSSHFQNKVLIFKKTKDSKELAKNLKDNPQLGYKFIGFINKKDLPSLKEIISKNNIQTIVIAKDVSVDPKTAQFFSTLIPLGINFLTLSRAYEIIFRKIPLNYLNEAWALENLEGNKKTIYEKTKRLSDIIGALLIILISWPLWLIISIAIILEDGYPVFYHQERIGKNNQPFILIKFRSMKKNAEVSGPRWAKTKDTRVTKVGRVLRILHLDELPQMINVLKGEISLVGPRPERPEFVEKLEKEIPFYNLRHTILPGFTGWAQINFRYARSIQDSFEKFQYDLYYIKNRSLILDLETLLKTLGLFFR